LTDEELRDELVTAFSVGGHQVTLGLAWAFALLDQSPDAALQLHQEVDALGRTPTLADVARLPFVAAVIDEALRLYPPFCVFAREARSDGTIGGYSYARGDVLLLSPWVTQRSPGHFESPDAFRPERWLGGGARPPPFAYFPFG